MSKASNTERARRVNAALALIQKTGSASKSAAQLAVEYDISRRQAYRYVREAELAGKEIFVPDQKIPFTVKLPEGLVLKIRKRASLSGQSLSGIVSLALEKFLSGKGERG